MQALWRIGLPTCDAYHADALVPFVTKVNSKENPLKLISALRALINIEKLLSDYYLPLFGDYYNLSDHYRALRRNFDDANIPGLVRLLEAHDKTKELRFSIMYGR